MNDPHTHAARAIGATICKQGVYDSASIGIG
jgi:hypothetical protein